MNATLRFLLPALLLLPLHFPDRSAPSASAVVRVGDTVTVCVHRVPVAHQADYEAWIRRVSAPAFTRAGERFESTRVAREAMRRLVPTRPGRDSVLTYVYVWERPKTRVQDEPGKSTKPGYTGVFEDAGMSPTAIDSALSAFRRLAPEASCAQQVEAMVPTGP